MTRFATKRGILQRFYVTWVVALHCEQWAFDHNELPVDSKVSEKKRKHNLRLLGCNDVVWEG